jgi:Cupin domain
VGRWTPHRLPASASCAPVWHTALPNASFDLTGDWHVEIKSKPALDLAVQSIVFQPGGQSGWHSHPGPVFIEVVSGTLTFYMSDDPTCTGIVRTAGQGYLDVGAHAHIARNETAAPAQTLVTYFAPPGAVLRIDEPNLGNCPF